MKISLSPSLFITIFLVAPAIASADVHALLIGISDYSGSKFSSLDGPHNDVALMRGILTRRFSIPDENIHVVLDQEATHSGLERAFADLAERLQPGDMVYIHFSGHGSYTDDLNGDERSKQDQTWVSHGSRRHSAGDHGKDINAYDVLDDEIDTWLARIFAKTDHVIFISDSCHSASVTRGQAPKVRAAPPDSRPHPRGQMTRSKPSARAIRIGAARDAQSAAEFRHEDGTYYGIFTWHWAQALDGAAPGATWGDLFQRASALVRRNRGAGQQPQMEGDPGLLVFGGEFTARQPTVAVKEVRFSNGKTWVSLDAGELAGVTVGSVYTLNSPAGAESTGARLEISDIWPQESKGTVIEGQFGVGDLLTEVSHAYPFKPVGVFIASDLPEGPDQVTVQALAQLVTNLPGYSVAESQATSDLVLRVVRPARTTAEEDFCVKELDALPDVDPAAEPEVWVLTPLETLVADDLCVSVSNRDRGLQLVQDNLTKLARVREFRKLGDARRGAPISVEAILMTPVPNCDGLDDCMQLGDRGAHRIRAYLLTEMPSVIPVDSLVTFRIKNHGPGDYYIYILSSGPDGEIGTRFPDPKWHKPAQFALLTSGESFDLFMPSERQSAIRMNSAGEEVVKIIASSDPIRTELLQQEGLRRRGADLKEMNPLERLLASAKGVTRVERGRIVIRNGAYHVTSINLAVVPAISN